MALETLISASELNSLIGQNDVVILDCRFYLTDLAKGKQEYEIGHIPNAIFVDVHHQLAGTETELTGRHPLVEAELFSQQLQGWGIDTDSRVVVYDDMGGAFAARAWWMLAQQGIDVRILNGGFPAWQSKSYVVTEEVSDIIPSHHRFNVTFPWAVDEQSVVENMELNQFQLVDARAADRFHGENETMDPVAGHIPGAINRPFHENLTSKGYFKPAEDLLEEWKAVLSASEHGEQVHYCGSGITACHNIVALNHAGIEATRVYVGAWSQWAKRMLRASAL